MKEKIYDIVDGVEKLEEAISRVKKAQEKFAEYTQEQVDAIFLAAASAANKERISLAKLAVEEAIRRTVESVGTVYGNAGEGAEELIYGGKTYTVYSDGSYSFVAPVGSGTAEVYDNSGNLISTFELTVVAD